MSLGPSNEKDRIDFFKEIERRREEVENGQKQGNREAAKKSIKKSLKLLVKAVITSAVTILLESFIIYYLCNKFLSIEISYVQSVVSLVLIRLVFRPYSNDKIK